MHKLNNKKSRSKRRASVKEAKRQLRMVCHSLGLEVIEMEGVRPQNLDDAIQLVQEARLAMLPSREGVIMSKSVSGVSLLLARL